LFDCGKLTFGGNVDATLTAYERLYASLGRVIANMSFHGPLADQIRFDQVICKQGGTVASMLDPLRKFQIEVHGFALRRFSGLELKLSVFRDGLHIASCHDTVDPAPLHAGHFISRFDIPEDVFRPGMYTLAIGLYEPPSRWAWCSEVAALDFSENLGERSADRSGGVVGIAYTAQRIQQNVANCSHVDAL